MAAYIISRLEVVDNEAYQEYRERLPGMTEAFGGRIVCRGEVVDVLGGEKPSGRHRIVVLEFSDVEQARQWHTAPENSPEYGELRALRNRAANAILTVIDGD